MYDERVRASAVCRAARWIFAVAAAIMPLAASAQSPFLGSAESLASSEASPAKRVTAPAPKQVDLNAVPQITAKELAILAARPQLPRPRTSHTNQQYAALKAQAAQRRFDIPNFKPVSPLGHPAAGSIPASAGTDAVLTPTAIASFPGNTQAGCAFVPALGGFGAPADMGLAVGDTNIGVLQINNVCISVFSKSGVLQAGYPKPLTTAFVGDSNACVTDPRALYDWANHRYILSFVQLNCSVFVGTLAGPSVYWVAVSTGDSPTGTYNVFHFSSTFGASVITDFPRLGQDRQAIYVASNVFDTAGNFLGEEWIILPKQVLYSGAALTGFAFDNPFGVLLDSSQPANVWNNTDNPRAEFFVTSLNAEFGFYFDCLFTTGCNGLVIWAVSNPLGAGGLLPELSAVFVPTSFSYLFPPNAAQMGTAASIDTGDVRITGEVTYGAGSLYAALTTGDGTGAASSILYRIQPVLGSDNNARCTGAALNLCPDITKAFITSENVLFYGHGNSAYYPTQQPDPEGNVTTVFNFSGPNFFGSTAFISTRVTQGLGAFVDNFVDSGFRLVDGQNTYEQGRWGDYTAVAPAGIGGSTPSPTMWFSGMFTDSGHNWATGIGKNGFTAPNQP